MFPIPPLPSPSPRNAQKAGLSFTMHKCLGMPWTNASNAIEAKAWNRCQVRENKQPVPSADERVTGGD